MRINHNIASMIEQNSSRTLRIALKPSLEKLLTSLRIIRVAEDVAAPTLSEKLRTQVLGLRIGNPKSQSHSIPSAVLPLLS